MPHAPNKSIAIRPITAITRNRFSRKVVLVAMRGTVARPGGLVKIIKKWYKLTTHMRAFAFAITFIFFFCLTYVFLGLVDALPNPPEGTDTEPAAVQQNIPADTRELPVRIVIPDIGTDWRILNPTGTDLDTLNRAVDEAPMRWPTSALLGQDGTVALFGHSSRLPIVRNQAYKAFNDIENLKKGQVVSVYSATTEYRYKVVGIRVASAEEDVVELPADGKYLVLVTCDTFGSKSDRFVVRADFEGAYAL